MALIFTLVLLAAVFATVRRRWRRTRLQAAGKALPGGTAERAIPIRSFTDIDDALRDRWCAACGGYLERNGEGTRSVGGRTLRVARLVCQECEQVAEIFFDTSELLH